MSKPAATLMVAIFEKIVCIKISGRANFSCSLDLKRLLAELVERGYKHFVLNLSECVTMDSTFLGTLAGIGLQFANKTGDNSGTVELVNPTSRINELLESLGVAHLFTITIAAQLNEKDGLFTPVASDGEANSRAAVTRTCLEAHQTLMSINPENVRKFKDVAQFLAEDLKKIEAQEGVGKK